MSALNTQEGGDHYKKMGVYQPWQVLAKWMTPEELKGYAKGTVVAYLAREADKGGRLDIKKALHTLQLYLELTEEPNPQTEPPLEKRKTAWVPDAYSQGRTDMQTEIIAKLVRYEADQCAQIAASIPVNKGDAK